MEDHPVMCDCTFCRQREAEFDRENIRAPLEPVDALRAALEEPLTVTEIEASMVESMFLHDIERPVLRYLGIDPASTPDTTVWFADIEHGKVLARIENATGISDAMRELKPEGVSMPAGLLAEVICWLRVAADRTNLRHLGTRAITPHDRYAPVKQSELAKVLSKVDAALRQLGVANVDMIIDRDPKTPVVSATDTREPLFVHKRTGVQYRLVNTDCPGKPEEGGWDHGVLYRGDADGVVRWTTHARWETAFKRVV